jgi:hypothetical protein
MNQTPTPDAINQILILRKINQLKQIDFMVIIGKIGENLF